MGYILKNTSALINTKLTDTARKKLSEGRFNISYFQVGDSEVSYNTLPSNYNQADTNILEPEFNAQNSTGLPETNKQQIKYPFYVDEGSDNTYGIPYMASEATSVFNRAAMRGFFTGNITSDTISWSALTNNQYAINSDYIVNMSLLNCTNKIELKFDSCYDDSVRQPQPGDFITIYYDGNGLFNCECVYPYDKPTPTPTPTLTVTKTQNYSETPTPTALPQNQTCRCLIFSRSLVENPYGNIDLYFNLTLCDGTPYSGVLEPLSANVTLCGYGVSAQTGVIVYSGGTCQNNDDCITPLPLNFITEDCCKSWILYGGDGEVCNDGTIFSVHYCNDIEPTEYLIEPYITEEIYCASSITKTIGCGLYFGSEDCDCPTNYDLIPLGQLVANPTTPTYTISQTLSQTPTPTASQAQSNCELTFVTSITADCSDNSSGAVRFDFTGTNPPYYVSGASGIFIINNNSIPFIDDGLSGGQYVYNIWDSCNPRNFKKGYVNIQGPCLEEDCPLNYIYFLGDDCENTGSGSLELIFPNSTLPVCITLYRISNKVQGTVIYENNNYLTDCEYTATTNYTPVLIEGLSALTDGDVIEYDYFVVNKVDSCVVNGVNLQIIIDGPPCEGCQLDFDYAVTNDINCDGNGSITFTFNGDGFPYTISGASGSQEILNNETQFTDDNLLGNKSYNYIITDSCTPSPNLEYVTIFVANGPCGNPTTPSYSFSQTPTLTPTPTASQAQSNCELTFVTSITADCSDNSSGAVRFDFTGTNPPYYVSGASGTFIINNNSIPFIDDGLSGGQYVYRISDSCNPMNFKTAYIFIQGSCPKEDCPLNYIYFLGDDCENTGSGTFEILFPGSILPIYLTLYTIQNLSNGSYLYQDPSWPGPPINFDYTATTNTDPIIINGLSAFSENDPIRYTYYILGYCEGGIINEGYIEIYIEGPPCDDCVLSYDYIVTDDCNNNGSGSVEFIFNGNGAPYSISGASGVFKILNNETHYVDDGLSGETNYNYVIIDSCFPQPNVSYLTVHICDGPCTTTTTSNPCVSPSATPTPTPTRCLPPTPTPACPAPPPAQCTVSIDSCHQVLTYRITAVCDTTIYLDRSTPDFSDYCDDCYARAIVYPGTMNELYDSVTPRQHWYDDVINFESVCSTDALDVKIWNMNIPWSETPAGIDPQFYQDYTYFGSKTYLGTKEYLGYASRLGQVFYNPESDTSGTTDTFYYNSLGDIVYVEPEEQKAIAIIHYTNNTIDYYYGEKFALQPHDPSNSQDTTGEARNFKIHLPWLMWHKNNETCCNGETFYVDPPNFEQYNLFQVNYVQSLKNNDMNELGIRYYHLWDTHPNSDGRPSRVGKVFPDSKLIIIDDEELIAAMSYKSNRNWTLPAPRLSLITPNTCGIDNNSFIGILTGKSQTLYVTYLLYDEKTCTKNLHSNYYSKIVGPNLNCGDIQPQNVAVRFGPEFNCLIQPSDMRCECHKTQYSSTPSPSLTPTKTPTPTVSQNNVSICKCLTFLNTDEGLDLDYSFTTCDGYEYISQLAPGLEITWCGYNPSGATVQGGGNIQITTGNTCSNDSDCFGSLPCCRSYNLYTTYLTTTVFSVYYCNESAPTVLTVSNPMTVYCASAVTVDSGGGYFIPNEICDCNNSEEIPFIPLGQIQDEEDVTITISGTLTPTYTFTLTPTLTPTPSITPSLSVSLTPTQTPSNTSTNTPTPSITPSKTPVSSPTPTQTSCPTVCYVEPGYYASNIEILVQLVEDGTRPKPEEWRKIDFTDQLSGTTINGYLTQSGLTGNTFVITKDIYDDADYYNLNDYINLTKKGTSGYSLNFGDEYYFYGNIETDIQATIYEMKYKVNLSETEFRVSSNPSWSSGTPTYITEVGLYDNEKDLMIVSKMQSPILRAGSMQIPIKFDF